MAFFATGLYILTLPDYQPLSRIEILPQKSYEGHDNLERVYDRSSSRESPRLLLKRYFAKELESHPTLLTYRPRIDCDQGRYLMVDNFISDGTGGSFSLYNAAMTIALQLNLTMVHFSWNAQHENDEDNVSRDRVFHHYDWEVPRYAWRGCPEDSPVRTNLVQIGTVNQACDETPAIAKRMVQGGLTVKIGYFCSWDSSFFRTQLIHEIRNWVLQRRAMEEYNRLEEDYIEAAVHVRKGDILAAPGLVHSSLQHRIHSDGAILMLLNEALPLLPKGIRRRWRWTIYSEGDLGEFDHYVRNLTALGGGVRLHLNAPATEGLFLMAESDIQFMGVSSFSFAAAAYNSECLHIGSGYDIGTKEHFDMWWGVRNFLKVKLDRRQMKMNFQLEAREERLQIVNATEFRERVIRTVARRDEERRRERERRLGYHRPPQFLENYNRDYPRGWMHIHGRGGARCCNLNALEALP